MKRTTLFLHGLDSSGGGTKGTFFKNTYPHVLRPDFDGSLEDRLEQLAEICRDRDKLVLVGTSFGGLMAACFAIDQPHRVERLVLLAPALNFPGYQVPEQKVTAPCYLLIGRGDTVTPPDLVLPRARQTFAELEINLVDDDHLLHQTFAELDWDSLLG